MSNSTTGQTVLATISNQSYNQGYRPRLIEFYGYEGEDFRHFQEILEFYLAVSNSNIEGRRMVILKSQLRRGAKVYFERILLKGKTDLSYEQAIEELKNHYITPELIQNYELEFSEMQQENQEHPQIFLARLREAADLANISNEAIIESRFRAGLLKEIKQFCIQSSSRTFKDWTNHADGWWNANRPRKIAMVDNPFIPRNINNALIYHDENVFNERHDINNHNVEKVDTDERPTQMIPVNNTRNHGTHGSIPVTTIAVNGPNQLSALEVTGYPNDEYYTYTSNKNHHNGPTPINSQQDICDMIQQAIRKELNQQTYNNRLNRNNNRNNRENYNYNQNDIYDGYNNGRYNNNHGYNNYNKFNNGYNNNGYNNRTNGSSDYNNYNNSNYGYQNNNSNYNQNQNQKYNNPYNQHPSNHYNNNNNNNNINYNQNENQTKNN